MKFIELVENAQRAIRYPELLLRAIENRLARVWGPYQFKSDCIVSTSCHINSPEMVSIGDGTVLKRNTVINAMEPGGIMFGRDCTLNQFSFLSGNILIGNGVRIANQVSMHSFNHRTSKEKMIHEQSLDMGEIILEDDVWIGTGSHILKDIHIGKGAVIGAGSVVTNDIPPYEIHAGNPAKQVGER